MNIESSSIQMVLFDLGGVIIRLGGMDEFVALTKTSMSQEEVWAWWLQSEVVRKYELGRCEASEFLQGLIQHWDMDISEADLGQRFADWPKGMYPGAADLVAEVRHVCEVACLTNTNALHWDHQPEAMDVRNMFQRHYASHELGMIKPDRNIFEHVIKDSGYQPDAILFLDDNKINVDAAIACGMQSRHVKGPTEARIALQELNVIV